MKNHIYIISQKNKRSYISSDRVDLYLSSEESINSTSHWWDGFLITSIDERDLDKALASIRSLKNLTIMRVAQSVDEYHQFTKQYWIDQSKQHHNNLLKIKS